MSHFSETFVAVLIYASLALTAAALVSLLVLVARDSRNDDIW